MDFTKLPKLPDSQQQSQPAGTPHGPPQPAPLSSVPTAHQAPEGLKSPAPEVFIHVVIGLLLLYLGWPLFDYLIHRMTGRPFNYPVTDASGNPLEYTKSVFIWINAGVALFGLALIEYTLLGRSANPIAAVAALLSLVVAAVVNVYAVLASLNIVGLQILPALCGAFAIYLGMYQWQRLKRRRVR